MEFWRTILTLLRRKSVLLPVLLLSLGVAAVTYVVMPTRYMSAATVVLTTSPDGGVLSLDPTRSPEKINPLRNFDGMRTAAAIIIQIMNTREMATQLGVVPGGATTFTVGDGSTIPQLLGTNGPFMVIEGYSASPGGAKDIVIRVEQRIRDELIRQQQALNAPPSTFIGMIDVIPPSLAEAQHGPKQKAAAGALVLGLITTTSAAYYRHRVRGEGPRDIPRPEPVAAPRDEMGTLPAESSLAASSTTELSTTTLNATGSDATGPDATGPDATEPDATGPDATEPDATEPSQVEPDSVEPDSTEPDPVGLLDPAEPDPAEPSPVEDARLLEELKE